MNRILVVDGEPQLRKVVSLNLVVRGYEAIAASTGEEALRAVEAEHPDLVLLDLALPDIDGLVVLERLRTWTDVPVIVITFRDDARSRRDLLGAGADDYVRKPFGILELMRCIDSRLH